MSGQLKVCMWLVLPALVAILANTEVDWTTENRKTFCITIANRRIYRQQRLEWYCQIKVRKVDEQVLFLFKNLNVLLT